jgi:hypothetical protein
MSGVPKLRGREIEAPQPGIVEDVSGDAHHEQVSERVVEHDLGRKPRIRASQDGGEGTLDHGDRLATLRQTRGDRELAGQMPPIPLDQLLQGLVSGHGARAGRRLGAGQTALAHRRGGEGGQRAKATRPQEPAPGSHRRALVGTDPAACSGHHSLTF